MHWIQDFRKCAGAEGTWFSPFISNYLQAQPPYSREPVGNFPLAPKRLNRPKMALRGCRFGIRGSRFKAGNKAPLRSVLQRHFLMENH